MVKILIMTIQVNFVKQHKNSPELSLLQVFAIEFIAFAIEFVPFAIEFVGIAIEFVPFAIEFVGFALQFVINKTAPRNQPVH